jgi:hypothetical protein
MLGEEVIWEILGKGMMLYFGFRSIFVLCVEAVQSFQYTFHSPYSGEWKWKRRWNIVYVSHKTYSGSAECGFDQLEELLRRKVGQSEVKSDSAPFVLVFWFKYFLHFVSFITT